MNEARIILDFEQGYERIGLPALVAQVLTGLWLAHLRLGSVSSWFEPNPLARVFQFKLMFLAGTVALALHARLRLIPRLRDETLPMLAAHMSRSRCSRFFLSWLACCFGSEGSAEHAVR